MAIVSGLASRSTYSSCSKAVSIWCHNGQFFVVDAGSLNGTYVNRQRVDQATLKNGDEIMIGKFRLVFFTKSAIISQ